MRRLYGRGPQQHGPPENRLHCARVPRFAGSLAETSNPESPLANHAEQTAATSMPPCRASWVAPRTDNGINSVLRARGMAFIPFPSAEGTCPSPLRHAWAVPVQNRLAQQASRPSMPPWRCNGAQLLECGLNFIQRARLILVHDLEPLRLLLEGLFGAQLIGQRKLSVGNLKLQSDLPRALTQVG